LYFSQYLFLGLPNFFKGSVVILEVLNSPNLKVVKCLDVLYDNKYTKKQDIKKAFYFYNKSCELNNGYVCNHIGFMYEVGKGINKNLNKSTKYYQKSYNLGNNVGCTFLGENYIFGKGIKINKLKALHVYRKSWDYGYSIGCIKYIYYSTSKKK